MYELAIIIPTLNESGNIPILVSRLESALASIDWEVIFVDDDSSDGTSQVVWETAASKSNVRCIRRVGRRGLSSACVEGMLSSGARYLAIMDADLQHDETLLSILFNGDVLPDGRVADAVYIVLNPPHRTMLNDAEVRPLDYEYLTKLSPGPQRLDELLSFQIYGAIASGRPRAKLMYSGYCMCAPEIRYTTFDQVKKQMFKLHAPHRQAGYITKSRVPGDHSSRRPTGLGNALAGC